MNATIEADIENGVIMGYDSTRLPTRAHVLITFLTGSHITRPRFGTKTSKNIIVKPDAFLPLTESELTEWGI